MEFRKWNLSSRENSEAQIFIKLNPNFKLRDTTEHRGVRPLFAVDKPSSGYPTDRSRRQKPAGVEIGGFPCFSQKGAVITAIEPRRSNPWLTIYYDPPCARAGSFPQRR
jgi:hypothetical protein